MEIFDRRNLRTCTQVRLVTELGNQLIRTEEALRMAADRGLDLVVVSTQSDPPVCRILDFKKALYEKKKAQKPGATSEVKEIQLKLNIQDHDLETKLNHARKFLERGDKVKLNLKLKGREREMRERVKELLDKAVSLLKVPVKVTSPGYGILILEKE